MKLSASGTVHAEEEARRLLDRVGKLIERPRVMSLDEYLEEQEARDAVLLVRVARALIAVGLFGVVALGFWMWKGGA